MNLKTSGGTLEALRVRYVGQLSAKAAGLTAACQAQDIDAIRSIAHQLRGSGKSYGFDDITDVANEIELACQDHRLLEVEHLITRFRNLADSLAKSIEEPDSK